jgi:hypothetical protein
MKTKLTLGLGLTVAAGAAAAFAIFSTPQGDCLWRRMSHDAARCVPEAATQVEPKLHSKAPERGFGSWSPSGVATSLFEAVQLGQPRLASLSDAQKGCRSPNDDGCARCCLPLLDSCVVCQGVPEERDLYVCSRSSSAAPCAAGCARCASCSKYDELQLRSSPSRPECHCRAPVIGDACFEATSCDCYCQRLGPAMAACPGIL